MNKNFQTYIHLFDTQVKPILLYACEAWADSIKHDEKITYILQKNKLETFHLSVLKRLLGVHKRTPNIAVLLETGRHPITLYAHIQSVKYFLRLPSTEKQSLLNHYYQKEKEPTFQNDDFIKYIKNKLDTIGMTNVWREQITDGKDLSKDAKIFLNIKTRLKDISSQTLLSTLTTNPGKLTFLAQTKHTHNCESYLYIDNFEHRKAITKIRTSSHKLAIETGRWNNINRGLRICKNCALDKVEDENHFLFECRMHVIERYKLIDTIKAKINVDLSQSPTHQEKLNEIFYSEDLSILNALGKFINNALKKRDSTSCYILPTQYIFYSEKNI